MPKTHPFWFIREGDKLIQVTKEAFDQAVREGKSVKYGGGYQSKKCERIAEQLEASRMALLTKPDLPTKFRAAITNPRNVIEIQVIAADDPQFWEKEAKQPKYQS